LVDLLRYRADRQGDEVLYRPLDDTGQRLQPITFGDLDHAARAIAARLQHQFPRGARALLMYDQNADFVAAFFGCLYAGLIPVPAYPPDPTRLARVLPRLNAITNDADPIVVLTSSRVALFRDAFAGGSPELCARPWLATDTVELADAAFWVEPLLPADALALLQYTSGSTATPKGVMVSHANLLHNEEMIRVAFGHDERTRVVGWLPVFHDMGLIGNVLQPVYMGVPCTLMSPMAFLRRPFTWLKAISDDRATSSGAPNFAYELCVRSISAEQRAQLDLSSWTLAFSGSEPVRAETLESFARTIADCGFDPRAFYPCYGLAEATLIVSGGLPRMSPKVAELDSESLSLNIARSHGTSEKRRVVGCGGALCDERIAIVDPQTQIELREGEVGEIWVAGPHVAAGYWKRPEQTERDFAARLAHSGEGPFLRTGDLGFMQDGELFVTGRCKDVIIVRGRNHYPQDIEHSACASHTALRPGSGAVFAVDVGGEERVVLVQELKKDANGVNYADVVRSVCQAITSDHQIGLHAAVLIAAGSIPKTTSGKICRSECRSLFQRAQLNEQYRWERSA
jgi:acyl-CoA synthetase (AMP-forming)/AMP-acid ligase II